MDLAKSVIHGELDYCKTPLKFCFTEFLLKTALQPKTQISKIK